ncbi:efflux RND transporter periplasmic adaptor subunit [Pseudomonas sp. CGJS7]|uniref:efflux RND transporter periplasmic adaptor subunit n=1 Tax=Pseudomonas sp. CGJS7 TaxID=3109348 RepID=UPI003008FDE8
MDVARPDLGQRKRRRQRVALILIGLALLTAAISVAALGARAPTLDRADAAIEVVRRGEFTRAVRGPGKLVPSQTRWVVARTDATVERVLIRPGMTVKADSALLELSNPDVQDRLLAAQSAYVSAASEHAALRARMQASLLEVESSLAQFEGQFESARVQEEASRLGHEKGVLSLVQYKQTSIEMRQLGNRVRIERQRAAQSKHNMQAQVAASQVRLDQLARTRDLRQLEADALRVKAGLDGVVQQIGVEEGQRVAAGVNLARVARPSTLMAELKVAESQAAELAPGQPATIEIGRARTQGKVRRVNPVVEKGTILVEVELTGALPANARSEQSVEGIIATDRLTDTLFVARPVNAIPDSDATVFRMTDSASAERVAVRFGKDSVNQIQILSGLKEGDKVIVSDISALDQATRVSIE